MKKIYRLLVSAIMVVSMLTLCACGDDKADDPNLGLYKATKAEMSGLELGVADLFENGFTIELKSKGKARVEMDGEGGNVKWTLDGDKFHAEGGGAVLDGTLRDGVMVLENLQDSGIRLTLVCDEAVAASKSKGSEGAEGDAADDKAAEEGNDSKADGSVSGKLGSLLDDGSEAKGGKWNLYTVTQNGKVYMENDLAEKGIEAWIEMNPDGTGRINLIGDLMDMTWTDSTITVPDNGEGGSDEYRYSFSNEYLVLVDGDMVLAFIEEGANSSDSSAAGDTADAGNDSDKPLYTADAEISEELMKRYEGDWHGIMLYGKAQGSTFSDRDGKKNDVIARICLDDKGNVTNAFFAAAMKDDPATTNFRNVTAELDPGFDGMYISGEFLKGGKFDTEFADVTDGLMFISMQVKADNGDSIDITIGMKRPDAKWTDADYPRYPDEGVEYYKGKSLEYVLSTFGNPPKGMPEQTHVTDWDKE